MWLNKCLSINKENTDGYLNVLKKKDDEILTI